MARPKARLFKQAAGRKYNTKFPGGKTRLQPGRRLKGSQTFRSLHHTRSDGIPSQSKRLLSTTVKQVPRNDTLGAILKLAFGLKPTSTSLILDLPSDSCSPRIQHFVDAVDCYCQALGAVAEHATLHFLEIRVNTDINAGGAPDRLLRGLPQVLRENKVLKTVWIQCSGVCNIGASTWRDIARALGRNDTLIDLRIFVSPCCPIHSMHEFGVEALCELAGAIRCHPSLKKVVISACWLELTPRVFFCILPLVAPSSSLRHFSLEGLYIPTYCEPDVDGACECMLACGAQANTWAELMGSHVESNTTLLHFHCPLVMYGDQGIVLSRCEHAIERNRLAHALLGVARAYKGGEFGNLKDDVFRLVFSFFVPPQCSLDLLDFQIGGRMERRMLYSASWHHVESRLASWRFPSSWHHVES